MNEFIVWDDKQKIFWGDKQSFTVDEIMISGAISSKYALIHVSYLNYIGKTDIEGNKIYADSSIVEYSQIEGCVCDILDRVCDCTPIKRKGYFSYSEARLGYGIELLIDNAEVTIWMEDYTKKDLKIIDTIQENKLGLIK